MSSVFNAMVQFADKFSDLVVDQAEWSQATFGSDLTRGPIGALKHLEREAREAAENPTDPMEYADCLLLILDAARRAGIKPMQLVEHAQAKMKINRSREWPKVDEWSFDQPHFVDSEDCMANPLRFWRVHAKRGTDIATGHGNTKEEAITDCKKNASMIPVEHVKTASEFVESHS